MRYYITRQTGQCIDYLNKKTGSFNNVLDSESGGYKTISGATKKLQSLQGIYKSYFEQSTFDNIKNKDINKFLYITNN
jgi:hypothetical protein